MILDRERHDEGVRQIREAGSRIRFITDGDVAAALLAVSEGTGVDLLWGIGGTPEGVISAAAIKCLGGQILGRLWPRDDEERQAARRRRLRDRPRSSTVDDLVGGDDAFFAASGVTDGDLLQGVRYDGAGTRRTESLIMRSRSGHRPQRSTLATTARSCARLRAGCTGREVRMYLIAGATGYVGGLLADELAARGRDVRCMARSPERAEERFGDRCEVVAGDVLEPETLGPALEGVELAYYLVHSMGRGGDGDFVERDRRGAAQLRRGGAGGRGRADRLPRRPGRGPVGPSALAPGDGRGAGLDRDPADLLPGGDRDRLGQRVAADDRLPGQAPAGDDHAELDLDEDAADRRRRRRRLPRRRARRRGVDRARDRDRRPRGDDLRRAARHGRRGAGASASGRGSACRCSPRP